MNTLASVISLRWVPVWRRNFRVWRKLLVPSMVGNFGEPLLYMLALGYGLGGFVGPVHGLSYIAFLAPGIVCTSVMYTSTFEGLYSAYTRMAVQQTWHGMLATPLRLEDIVLGEALWTGTKGLISAVAIVIVAALLGLVRDWAVLGVFPIVMLAGVSFGCMALVVTALAASYDFFLYYFTLIITPMFLLSGVFFPLDNIPEIIKLGSNFLPLTHAVEIIRPLMTGQPAGNVLIHVGVLVAYALSGFLIATILFRRRLIN